jgi:hypothetical protein
MRKCPLFHNVAPHHPLPYAFYLAAMPAEKARTGANPVANHICLQIVTFPHCAQGYPQKERDSAWLCASYPQIFIHSPGTTLGYPQAVLPGLSTWAVHGISKNIASPVDFGYRA